jgi:hypothetical protein
MSMRRFMFTLLVIVALAALLAGCVSPARSERMTVYVEPTAPLGLQRRITIVGVEGSGETNTLKHSTVGDLELRDALQRSLGPAGYLSPDASSAAATLDVHMLALESTVGLDSLGLAVASSTITSRIRYVLKTGEGSVLLDDIVPARCTIRVAEIRLAPIRVQRATECSVGKNIAAFLWRVRALSLAPPLRPPEPTTMSQQEADTRVETLLTVPAVQLAEEYLDQLYVTKVVPIARAGGTVTVYSPDRLHPDRLPITIIRTNADVVARQYADTLAFVHSEAIRRRGFRQVAGAFAMKAGPGCEQLGFVSGPAWIEQRGHAILLDAGDRDVNEGLAVEDGIAWMHGIRGPEGRFFGAVTAERLELRAPGCTLTLTPTIPG